MHQQQSCVTFWSVYHIKIFKSHLGGWWLALKCHVSVTFYVSNDLASYLMTLMGVTLIKQTGT